MGKAHQILGLFDASEYMLEIGVPALRIICLSFLLAGFGIVASSFFQSLGHGVRRGGEADEDLVHAEGHHRADGGHDDGGHAHGVDAADDLAVGAEALEA